MQEHYLPHYDERVRLINSLFLLDSGTTSLSKMEQGSDHIWLKTMKKTFTTATLML